MVSRINRGLSRADFAKIAAKGILEIIKTGLNIEFGSLHKGFDGAVRQISHIASQIVPTRRPVRGISKPHTLYTTFENNVLSNPIHGPILESFKITRNKKGETVHTSFHLELFLIPTLALRAIVLTESG